ncbi:MAG: peptidylprolyl isomerase [Bacillota bacterium]|nr:peptidylprolyl isomerase [Bacillota bacterium]
MNKFKRLLSIAAIGILTLSSAGCVIKTQEGKDNTVVGKVGDTKITVADVKKLMANEVEGIKAQYGANYKNNDQAMSTLQQDYTTTLDNLAEDKILYLAGKEMNLLPDPNKADGEVQALLDSIKMYQYGNDQTKMEQGLEQNGATVDSLRDSLKEELKDNPEAFTAEKVRYAVAKDVTVSDDDVQAYYTKNISIYTTQPGADMWHIVVATEDEAKNVKAQLDKGAKYEDMAKQHSTDADTKDKGGEMGYLYYTNTAKDKDMLATAQKLNEGQISDPVKTTLGWEIVKVTGVQREAKVIPLADKKADIKDELIAQKRQTTYSDKVAAWKKQYGYSVDESKLLKNIF